MKNDEDKIISVEAKARYFLIAHCSKNILYLKFEEDNEYKAWMKLMIRFSKGNSPISTLDKAPVSIQSENRLQNSESNDVYRKFCMRFK